MDHGEVDVPLCLNNAFSYAVLLFNNVYGVFLGIPSMRLFFQKSGVCLNSVSKKYRNLSYSN